MSHVSRVISAVVAALFLQQIAAAQEPMFVLNLDAETETDSSGHGKVPPETDFFQNLDERLRADGSRSVDRLTDSPPQEVASHQAGLVSRPPTEAAGFRTSGYREPVQAQPAGAHQHAAYGVCGHTDCPAATCLVDCPCFWQHRTGIFGEFLYLHPRDADIQYAAPVDGFGTNAVPIGQVGVADPDYQPGFRVGGSWALTPRSSLHAAFSHFESQTNDERALPGGDGFLRAETVHPNTENVASDSLSASAAYDIDFDLVDVTYKRLIWGNPCSRLDYVVGLRYGRLEQDFGARYAVNGETTVDTEIDFDGLGPRLGLEGERLLGRGFLVYGQTFANFLAGEFQADYRQENIFTGTQAVTGFEDDRIVSLLELELGVGWQSPCGRFRWTAGYYIGSWFNAMTTPGFVDAVQANDLNDVEDTLTFDGLTTRVEYRF